MYSKKSLKISSLIFFVMLSIMQTSVKTIEDNRNDEDLKFKEVCEPQISNLLRQYDNIKNKGYLGEERVTHKVLKLSEEEKKKYGITNDVFEYTESIVFRNDPNETSKYLDKQGFVACFNETNINGRIVKGGICKDWFKKADNECEFGEVGSTKQYPACCTKEKCECTCWYACETKKSIKAFLRVNHKVLSEFNNAKCTTNVTSIEEAKEWRKTNCNLDRENKTMGSHSHRQFEAKLKKCRYEEADEEYCQYRGTCWLDTKICRFCYRWICKKEAKEQAKKGCESILKDSKAPKEKHEKCRQRQKTDKWLEPAYIKKKRKKIEATDEKSHNQTNLKHKPHLKSRSTLRSTNRAEKKGEEQIEQTDSFKHDLVHENNLEYFIT